MEPLSDLVQMGMEDVGCVMFVYACAEKHCVVCEQVSLNLQGKYAISLIYMSKSCGERHDPCGTPAYICRVFDFESPIRT